MCFTYIPEENGQSLYCTGVREIRLNFQRFLLSTQLPALSQPAPWEGTSDLDMNTALLSKEEQGKPATSKYTSKKPVASHPRKAKLFF